MTVLLVRFTIDMQSTRVATALLLFSYFQEALSIVHQFARMLAYTDKKPLDCFGIQLIASSVGSVV